jgi:hypothetical protein
MENSNEPSHKLKLIQNIFQDNFGNIPIKLIYKYFKWNTEI